MTVVRITIKKTLTDRTYPSNPYGDITFSSEYLVRTDAPFEYPQVEAYAVNLAEAERRLYSARVRFDSAIVKLATPGAVPADLRGEYFHVCVGKGCGQWVMAEEDVLAYPAVTAIYVRQAQWGRNGRLMFPYALTTAEWNLYTQKRVVPSRFLSEGALDEPWKPSLNQFSQELIEAVRADNGTHIMPSAAGENEQGLRQVTRFVFTGFEVNSLKRRKKRPGHVAKENARIRAMIQQAKEEADPSATPSLTSKRSKSKSQKEGVVYLLKAGPHYKIGKSVVFDKRLGQIKLQLPYAVEVVHTIRAANVSEVESYWHRRFASLRQNGEWFSLTEAEVEEFKSISTM